VVIQAELTKARLVRAEKLTNALGDEGVRWSHTAEEIAKAIELLIGDVLAAAATISYQGAFTAPYRQDLNAKWISRCKEKGIPIGELATLRSTLGSPVEIREWNILGLPTDDLSVDNGIMVKCGYRWPLMIDPQCQAALWVKNMEAKNGLRVLKLTDNNFLRMLESSIRVGNPVLLEDVGEVLDPSLEPLLTKAISNVGGRTILRLGDSDIDFDPKFKFYITTKLTNPHYLPDVCIKVTVINFTVTMKGLEDQLLGDVVRTERPDLEEQKDNLVLSISADKKQLTELESKILRMLKESKGNILDDSDLINTLNNSKVTSGMIQGRVKEAETTEKMINDTRESYRPAAIRGSTIYFVMADLSMMSPMYQYSLTFFSKLFKYSMEHAERSEDVPTRVDNICTFANSFIYTTVQRGLFANHKLIFSFLLATAILRHPSSGEIGTRVCSSPRQPKLLTIAMQSGAYPER
jgi:dynein heavy chain, axonemal